MSSDKESKCFFRDAMEHALNKEMAEAIAEQLALVKLNPSDPKPYCALGTFFHMQGRLDDSVLMYRHALQLDPNFALAHQHLGQLFASRGEWEQACYHAREAARSGNCTLLRMLERYKKAGG